MPDGWGGKREGGGGRQPGAGRPPGSRNVLPHGAVAAMRALRHRVPKGTAPELERLADEALETVASVMRGEVWFQEAGPRLRAATIIREEVCGRVEDRLQVTGGVTIRVVSPYAVRPPALKDGPVVEALPVDAPPVAPADEAAPPPPVVVEHGDEPPAPPVVARWPTVRKRDTLA